MLRFQRPDRQRPRNYLARREQYRLFALIVGLGAVVVLIRQLPTTDTDPASAAPGSARESNSTTASANPPAEPGVVGGPEDIVDRARLELVRDNSDFRTDEKDAWFYLFSLVQSSPGNQPAEEVTYTQLIAQPHVYRGKLVRVEGAVKRIEAIAPGENDLGITTLYRVILQPKGHSLWPILVYCRDLPPGWVVGEPQSNQVVATGYFFKNLSYTWRDGLGLAPVIVCQSFAVREARHTQPVVKTAPVSIGTIVASALAIAGVVVVLVLWRTTTFEARANRAVEAAQVGDALQKLAQEGD